MFKQFLTIGLFLIPKLKSDDRLIITIPFYGRQRIPTQIKREF